MHNLDSSVIYRDRVPGDAPVRLGFLDIDGVLDAEDMKGVGVKPRESRINLDWVLGIDPHRVALINQVLGFPEEYRVFVVLSTSWRISAGVGQTEDALRRAGFAGVIVGATPNLGNKRAEEIQAFLEDWNAASMPSVQRYVIFDDAEAESLKHLKDCLVQTIPGKGIGWAEVFKAQQMLFER